MSHVKKRTNVGRQTRAKMCANKAPRTELEAKEVVERRVAAGAYRLGINCYPCKHCKHWHVGGRDQNLVASRRQRR